MKLLKEECDLIGTWRLVNNVVVADFVCQRIEHLIKHELERVGADAGGWDTLFRDPADGRLWELIYQQSDSQGGGAPRLTCIEAEVARHKYGSVFPCSGSA